jgi:ABC-type phosphate/phosphonate transport system substrate-binding protein
MTGGKRPRTTLAWLLGLGAAAAGWLWAAGPQAASALRQARLNVAASDSLFGTVNASDAIATMRIWTDQVGRNRGFQFASKVEIARTAEQLRQRLRERDVDMLVLDTPDYLALADSRLIEVVAAGTRQGQLGAYPYLLLTKEDLGPAPLRLLKGKKVAVASRTKSNLGLVWLETLLAEGRLGRAGGYFASLETGYRAVACVLPLFFGKIDACIVDSANWESLQELNPQLGQLRAGARSEPLLEGLIAMPVQPHPYQKELVDSILSLHKTAGGEQLGMIFKTGPLVRAGREQFESVRALIARYRRLVDGSGERSEQEAAHPATAAGRERP